MLATFNHLIRGAPIIYQGEEIGQLNWPFNYDQINDIDVLNFYQILVKEKQIYTDEQFLEVARKVSRDNARTPVQWNNMINGGFSKSDPWLPTNYDFAEINYEESVNNPASLFYHYQELIKLRKSESLVSDGEIALAFEDQDEALVVRRFDGKKEYEIWAIINFFDKETRLDLSSLKSLELILSNYGGMILTECVLNLRHYEAVILKVLVN